MGKVSFTTKGYIEVWYLPALGEPVFVSRHKSETEAVESLTAYAETLPGPGPFNFELRYPNKIVKAYGILALGDDTTPPSVPANLFAYATGATTVSLSWDASTDGVGVTGYQVFRDGVPIATTANAYYNDTGLTPSTSYTYTVAAYDAAGNNSAASSGASVTTDANSAPVWSIDTQALTTDVAYSLLLTDACSDSDGDTITFTQVSGTLPTGVTFNSSAKTVSGTPTTVGTSVVTFRASDGITTTDQAITFEVLNADTTAPSVPTDLAGSSQGGELITLTWTASSDPTVANARTSGLAGYRLYRDGLLFATLGLVTTYDDSVVAAGVTYSYTLAAYDAAGNASAQTAAVEVSAAQFGWTIPDTPLALPDSGWSTGAAPVTGTGATFPISQYVNAAGQTPTYSILSGGGTGISIDSSSGLLTVDATAAADTYAVSIDLAPPGTDVTTLGISGAGAFTFGLPLADAVTTPNEYVTATGTNLSAVQIEIRNRWASGRPKFAVISGITTAADTLSIKTSASDTTSGTALSLASMRAVLTGSITVGTQTVNLATMVASAPQRTVATGPVMSNWIFRQALTVGTDLSLWVDVRYYANGSCEVFPWVENATLQTVAPVNYVGTCSVTIGSTTTNLGSIDFKARTRIPLLSGTSFAYRTSGSEVTPAHDVAYLRATKLVPNYGYAVSESTLAGLQQTYTPNMLAGVSSAMGQAGGEGSVNGPPCAAYASSGDVRAYRAAITFGLSGGSWSVHLRDGGTQEPFRFSSYPSPAPAAITGGTNGTAAYSHLPGFAFIPYLVTGRWWFLDEVLLWSCYVYYAASTYRQGSKGIADPTHYGVRGAAWALNTHAHALSLLTTVHPNRADLIYTWEQNCSFYRTAFVDGGIWSGWDHQYSTPPNSWVSPAGYIGGYSASALQTTGSSAYGDPNGTGAWWDAAFQQNYQVCVWGVTSDYELPVSAQAQSDHIAVRNHAYNQVVGRTSATNWRRFEVYDYPLGSDAEGLPCETWYTADQAYAKYLQGYGLSELPMTEGLSIKFHGTDDDLTLAQTGGMNYATSALMGLALAKEHGASGADASYRRVTTASNAGLFAQWHAIDPSYGVVPR